MIRKLNFTLVQEFAVRADRRTYLSTVRTKKQRPIDKATSCAFHHPHPRHNVTTTQLSSSNGILSHRNIPPVFQSDFRLALSWAALGAEWPIS